VYIHGGTLFAAPMDLARLELTGPAAPVLEEVASNPANGSSQFDFSRTGTFIYVKGNAIGQRRSILWLDSAGKTQPLLAKPGAYWAPRFSPDGKRLALVVLEGGNWDIWVYDWQRDRMTRLTFAAGFDGFPVWTPDGKYIAYGSADGIYRIRADGAGKPQRLTESKNVQAPYSFSPDGKRLAFFEFSPETNADIWTLPIGGDPEHPQPGKPEVFLRTSFQENFPAFSPDGRWLAYTSNDSGASEVYVRPFPGPGGKWPISNGGGLLPVWSQNGSELFYRTRDNRIMVAAYTAKGDSFAAGKPRLWSEKQFLGTGYPNFDLAPDGKRFAVLAAAQEAGSQKAATHVTFLLNFFDELRRRVPASGK
jgi:Tol biopolymer transport system component